VHPTKLVTKNKKKLLSQNFFIAGVVDTTVKHSFVNISTNFPKKFEMVLMRYSGDRGKLIYKKKLKPKILCPAMSTISKGSKTKLRAWFFKYRREANLAYSKNFKDRCEANSVYSRTTKIEAKRPLLIPDIRKIETKRTLLIPYSRKIQGNQSLLIQELKKIEAKRTRLIPEIGKIEAKRKPNWIEVKRTEVVFLKLLWSPGIDSKELILPAYALRAGAHICRCLRRPGIDSEEPVRQIGLLLHARQAENRFLGSLKGLQIRALYNNPIPAQFLVPLDFSKVPAPCWYF
jgi:hypothetical protein